MRIYHGSLNVVRRPEVRPSSRTLDYGTGFYATTSDRQAEDWVRRRAREAMRRTGYVNVYDLDPQALQALQVLTFAEPDEAWVDFVMRNRTEVAFRHDYDVVYGPVANDRVYAAFALFEGGFLDKTGLIAELRAYKLVDQYLFHTERAVALLSFVEAREVGL